EDFRFLYTANDKYRILSTVTESVYINKMLSHRANILNRITVDVRKAEAGGGELSCVFQTSEEAENGYHIFSWGKTYDSEFFRDAFGRYKIGEDYFMPIVRNVPVFPERSVSPGDSWTAPGEEVHDFSVSLGVVEPVRFPIDVQYRYAGVEPRGGESFHVFHIEYEVSHKPVFRSRPGGLHPVLIAGFSRQKLFWDASRGRPHAYEEEFDFVFELSNGESIQYTGTAQAEIIESARMDKDSLVREIENEIKKLDIPDTRVEADALGVTLTLENIQFPADSARLVPSEKQKLDRLCEILRKYPTRDILITGHTALAGKAEGRQRLSEDRAASVGAYLLEKGVRSKERMNFRGMGAEVPVADNRTEEGRTKNRRVEITIMEN
ncbi:MAG: OmpA family protein, partial [Spirochaetales bacterium]|nr:OmpA family protein [Spirochaetales bacterium]